MVGILEVNFLLDWKKGKLIRNPIFDLFRNLFFRGSINSNGTCAIQNKDYIEVYLDQIYLFNPIQINLEIEIIDTLVHESIHLGLYKIKQYGGCLNHFSKKDEERFVQNITRNLMRG